MPFRLQGDGDSFSWLDRLAAYLCYHRGFGSHLLDALQPPGSGLATRAAGRQADAAANDPDSAVSRAANGLSSAAQSVAQGAMSGQSTALSDLKSGRPSAAPQASDMAAALLRRLLPETEAAHSTGAGFGTAGGGTSTMRLVLGVAEASAQRLAEAAARTPATDKGAALADVGRLTAAMQVSQSLSPLPHSIVSCSLESST